MLNIILILLLFYIFFTRKKFYTRIKQNIEFFPETNNLKILTYNIQRVPYFFLRPNIDINKLLESYDILCLQEDFYPNIFDKNLKNINVYHIGTNKWFKITDSGLTIYSKVYLEFIEFINFKKLESVDKLSDKGFLVTKYLDTYIINTHLQATYYIKDLANSVAYQQLNEIFEYLNKKKIKKFIILGDFNIDLDKININYNKAYPNCPTHYSKMNSIIFNSSAVPKKNYYGFIYDGAIYDNISCNNVRPVIHDNYTDHMGVSLNISF